MALLGICKALVDHHFQIWKWTDIFQINTVLSSLQVLVARGFASEEEADGLNFSGPNSISVRIVTRPEAPTPTTRIRLVPRDAISFYARTPVQATVFILDQPVAEALLKRSQDFLFQN